MRLSHSIIHEGVYRKLREKGVAYAQEIAEYCNSLKEIGPKAIIPSQVNREGPPRRME
jgi:hypothetical protein